MPVPASTEKSPVSLGCTLLILLIDPACLSMAFFTAESVISDRLPISASHDRPDPVCQPAQQLLDPPLIRHRALAVVRAHGLHVLGADSPPGLPSLRVLLGSSMAKRLSKSYSIWSGPAVPFERWPLINSECSLWKSRVLHAHSLSPFA